MKGTGFCRPLRNIEAVFWPRSSACVYPSRSRSCVRMVDGWRTSCQRIFLGNINKALSASPQMQIWGDKSAVPTIDYLAVQSKLSRKSPWRYSHRVGNLVTFKLDLNFWDRKLVSRLWLARSFNWLFALISSPTVVCKSLHMRNALRASRTSGWTESCCQVCGITSFIGLCLWSCSILRWTCYQLPALA